MKRRTALLLAPAAALPLALMATPAFAASSGSTTTYQATLTPVPLNGQTASGTITVRLTGNTARITEHVTGLAATFNGAPYPHVQHIHGLAMGTCPPASADSNGDGVIAVSEGAPSYGGIQTTLTVSGDTSPTSATNLKRAPSGSTIDYTRTIQVSQSTVDALTGGTAVVVVHGLDPAKAAPAATKTKSELVPSLPLAATSPALCGALKVVPAGGVATGLGSGPATQLPLFVGGGVALLAAGGLALAARRQRATAAR